ncbi:hypothetical protein VHUM_02368 [Vanrija humicola]|uniref:Ricin B lectin domain-containing protein n=1 Tax=Vanrija humicola TaxID=5417 RepID=A0A7D8Z6M4_VANHU|nr:hypothetical protein VHUM_02368 [Vanrija humicola]
MFTKLAALSILGLAAAQTVTVTVTVTAPCQSQSSTATPSSSTTAPPSSTTAPPTSSGKPIHPNGNNAKCLDVQGNVQANGTPVQIYDCNGSAAQNWIIKKGSTSVQLAGSNYCLDASSSPGNGVGLKIWQCYPGLTQQTWWYTDDNRIAVQGQGQCLDLTNGDVTNGIQQQTWQCTGGNTNQIWTQ